jgi:UDP-GlcNAc3NAcA epimerase
MPEEINRIVTDRISRWLLCPSDTAVKNLGAEGIRDSGTTRVANVGDVMYDVWLRHRRHARTTTEIETATGGLVGNYYLATIHREETLMATTERAPIWNIVMALERIARTTPVVMPLHPRTRQLLAERPPEHIRVIAPVGYLEMITLISQCRAVFTDSGGLQKEAYYSGKPCVTLRAETEWVELVEEGANVLVGTDPERIFEAERAISCSAIRVGTAALYGDGNAAERVVNAVAVPA